MHNSRAYAEIVGHLTDRIRRRVPRKANALEFGGIECVVRRKDSRLVVNIAV